MKPLEERFWSKVKKTDGCWLWTGAKRFYGYGHLGVGKRGEGNIAAHRLSYALAHGVIPPGMHVLHRCDNTSCVRLSHLFLGTHTDNMRDMMKTGRSYWRKNPKYAGENCAVSKLTKGDVRIIRERYAKGGVTQTQLGKEYGVKQTTISMIITSNTWKYEN